jgi:hypothetical protein
MGIGHLQVLTRGISHVTAVPAATLGDRIVVDGNEYVYVYNASSDLTAKVGYGVTASGATGWSCVISHVTAQLWPVGVVHHVDIPVGEYGWVMSKGFANVGAGLNTGLAVNDDLQMVATTNTGNISRKTLNSATSNEAFRISPFGVCVVATGTGGTGKAKIWCN